MAARRAHLVRLAHREDARRIGTGLDLRLRAIRADGLDDEIGAAAAEQSSRVAPAGPEPVVRRARHLAHLRHELVALDVGIEHVGRADLQRDIAARANRIDGDDRRRARDSRALNGAQAERTAADDGRDRAGRDGGQRLRRGRPEAGDAHAAAHHAELDGARFREHRHDPLLERHHQLGEAADVRAGVHGRAVAHVGDRHEIVRPLAAEELAHVGAAAQALIAVAALRRARHADAVADLHAAHLRPHRFDDADAAVSLNQRHLRHRAAEHARQAEHVGRVRVAEVGRFGPDDDLPSADRPQRQLLKRRPAGAGAARHPPAKLAAGCGGPRRLSGPRAVSPPMRRAPPAPRRPRRRLSSGGAAGTSWSS